MAPNATGPAPYGYRIKVSRELLPVPEEQAVLWLVAHLRRQGWPLQKIADELNRYGLTSRQGLPFSKQTVHLILGRLALSDTG